MSSYRSKMFMTIGPLAVMITAINGLRNEIVERRSLNHHKNVLKKRHKNKKIQDISDLKIPEVKNQNKKQ